MKTLSQQHSPHIGPALVSKSKAWVFPVLIITLIAIFPWGNLSGQENEKNRIVTVARKMAPGTEKDLYKLGYPWSGFQPTGFVAEKGKALTVIVETDEGEPTPNLTIVNLRAYDWNDQASIPLSPGTNKVVPQKSGIIYIKNSHSQKKPPVIRFSDATPMPLYRHGKTTPDEWRKMLRMPNTYGMVEISTDRILITVTAEKAKLYLRDPKKLCESFDEIMNVYARLLGLSPKAQAPHDIPQNLMHLIEVNHSYMYATNHRTAFHRDTVHCILDDKILRKDGWGPWHEIGHMHQVQEYKFQGLGEVTVNIFSLEVQHHFGNRARIDNDKMRKSIKKHFANPNRNYHEINDLFMKVAMFWQLRLAFGDDFYPQLHRLNREKSPKLKTDEEKLQYFIQLSSQVSGYDLSPFFLAWGLKPSTATSDLISKQKKLSTPIWRNFDFSTVRTKGTLGIAQPRP
jgi:hypothetical protein